MLLYPYKSGSTGAKALAQAIGARRIKHTGSRLRGGPDKTVLNWGANELPPEVQKCRVLNTPESVSVATNKLQCFQVLEGHNVGTVPYTASRGQAGAWLAQGKAVVQRTLLRASAGRGIIMADTKEDLVNAPLYTQYIKKESEWRVHIIDGDIIDIQRKVRDSRVPTEDVDWRVRNHDRGFIFQRHDVHPPVEVVTAATEAVAALGLFFGAVDVIFNRHHGKAYVLEVNCAPGLEGTTLENYARKFREVV